MTMEDVFAERLQTAMENKQIGPSHLAAALGVSLDWLMGRDDPQAPKDRDKQKRGRKLKVVP